MSLISAFISHQIWLQRNATSEVNELRPFIEQMRKEVKKQVLAFGDESRTKAKLSADTVRVERGDGVAALRQRGGLRLDVVFLDPPFADGQNDALVLSALAAARAAVGETGLIYLEAPRVWSADELAQTGLQVHRQGKAGQVAFHLLRLLPAQ